MTVPAVRAGDVVILVEHGAGADGDCFLAQIQMNETRHLAGSKQVLDAVLEVTDLEHALEHQDQRVTWNVHVPNLKRLYRN